MASLILIGIVGLAMAFFATQNFVTTTLRFGSYALYGVPLYLLVLGSMLLGVFVSWLVSLANGISSSLAIRGRESDLRRAQDAIDRLKKDNQDLKLELAHARSENNQIKHDNDFVAAGPVHDNNGDVYHPKGTFFDRVKHSLQIQ